ncbi:hypothetical protein WJX74_002834 [Apatococcus lobatus]|uniref:Peptidase S8/S53 domain-containing protein n=1 Tax=Apatococcus lobatus TaxID=904363 RepID=A0AAW1SF46_9CHLO
MDRPPALILLVITLLACGVPQCPGAQAPAMLPSSAPSASRLLSLGYADPGVQVNASQELATGFPPVPAGLTVVSEAPAIGLVVCALDPDVTLSPADFCAKVLLVHPEVSFCEPDTATATISQAASATNATNQRPSASPDDPLFSQQYSLRQVGLPAAWSSAQLFGSTTIHVCVVDTGIDTSDAEFAGSVFNGTAFVGGQQSSDYTDGNSHGSFTAGVVGAASNNGLGVTGAVQRPSLLICRFMDATGSGSLSDAALCFDWCIRQQAAVISCSFGGTTFSQALQAAVQAASAQNVFVATSAGNNGVNSDVVKQYPSAFAQTLPGVMAVAASDASGALWPRSNYGPMSVQIAAPGVSVLGLGLGGVFVTLSGTSMAAPLVAGIAALLFADAGASPSALRQNAVADGIKQAIQATSTRFTASADAAKLNGGSGGVVSVPAAIAAFRSSRAYSAVRKSSISATVVAAFAGIAAGIVVTLLGVVVVIQARQLAERRRDRARVGLVDDGPGA